MISAAVGEPENTLSIEGANQKPVYQVHSDGSISMLCSFDADGDLKGAESTALDWSDLSAAGQRKVGGELA